MATTVATIDVGGTGATTAAGALTALGAAPIAAYAQANSAYTAANNASTSANNAVLKAGDTMTGALALSAGNSAVPAITRSGDTDTGVYFPAANEMAVTTGGTVAAAFNNNGVFFRNRIINGDMRIDQRNAGANVIPSDGNYTLDRWGVPYNGGTGRISVQQVTDVPTGFVNSLKCTVTTAASGETTSFYALSQPIEGFNFSDLGWGSANARTITISFWVKSSIAGQYSFYLANYPGARYYCTSYTISAANTWEYKTITVAGDTSGTYATTTSGALWFRPILGAGSSFQGATPNTWSATNLNFITGSTQWIGTLNATFFITGVQLETGSVATPFERRPYGTELMLCQRYYEKSEALSIWSGNVTSGSTYYGGKQAYKVTKRATPTLTFNSDGNFSFPAGDPSVWQNGTDGFTPSKVANATNSGAYYQYGFTASIEL